MCFQVDEIYHHPSLGVEVNVVVVKIMTLDDRTVSVLKLEHGMHYTAQATAQHWSLLALHIYMGFGGWGFIIFLSAMGLLSDCTSLSLSL